MIRNRDMKKFTIGLQADGWDVINDEDGTRFEWNHNDEDMGTKALKELLEYLGYEAKIEEWY